MSEDVLQTVQERARQDRTFWQQLVLDPLTALSNYDLTEAEKHSLIAPNFRWQVPHKLAGVSYPRSEAALALLKAKGIGALLSLAESPLAPDRLAASGLQAEHLPVADFTAPTIPQIEQAIEIINRFLAQNIPVAVHCAAGLGRTGTILASYLVSQGLSAQDAIERVRSLQPGSIETPDQVAMIALYELHRGQSG
ncbi:MAG TPA: dual specificity protein phosphatase 23 [Ktedonosporobacter sp.]|nr:dual specificity protein phosphatase 23 [Ktedonosporobacter sp.]